jgi:hypothetical protein
MKKILLFLFIITICVSCDSFLEESSQDLSYVTSYVDLDEILVGDCYLPTSINMISKERGENNFLNEIHVMGDDLEEHLRLYSSGSTASRDYLFNVHHWQINPFLYQGVEIDDNNWFDLYKKINALNVVLFKADEMSDNPEELKRIKGEALFLRAWYYFHLVNTYAQPYSNSTKGAMGVPIKLSPEVEDVYYTRNSVGGVYDRIVSDLKESILLSEKSTKDDIFRANYYAPAALLSKVYLYMQNYKEAVSLASVVIESGYYRLYDLKTLGAPQNNANRFLKTSMPEIIFTNGSGCITALMPSDMSGGVATCYKPSEELLSIFSQGDLRRSYLFDDTRNQERSVSVKEGNDNNDRVCSMGLLRLADIYLVRAEAYAMDDQEQKAVLDMETLLSKRYADQVPLIDAQGEELVNFIRDDRRKELCFEGNRWFDLRRYAVCEKYPFTKIIRHPAYQFSGDPYVNVLLGHSTLNEYGNEPAYVLPIPPSVIMFNKGSMIQNPSRSDRSINLKKIKR